MAIEVFLFFVGSAALAVITVYFFRDRQRVGEVLVNWWIEESDTSSGRRKLSSGTWGSKKWEDADTRRQTAALTGWILPIIFGMGSGMLVLAGLSILLG
jgi:hypothetical protein